MLSRAGLVLLALPALPLPASAEDAYIAQASASVRGAGPLATALARSVAMPVAVTAPAPPVTTPTAMNVSQITQSGVGNGALVSQIGGGNLSVLAQRGSGNVASVSQTR